MASLLAKAKNAREAWWPVLKASAFVDRGVLTPQEFVEAGDELVFKCPTWCWASGEASRRKAYLPEEKQFLVTTNVPCAERAAALEGSVDATGDDDDEWVVSKATSTAAATSEEATAIGDIVAADDDLAALEDDTVAADAATAQTKILKTRTYDLSITYDKYWQTPRMWFYGYAEDSSPLTQPQVFEDIILDYARRTVTFELHPHLATLHASIHPCKHPAAMKRIIDQMRAPPRPDQALFLFLKFIQSVVPTINYDFTLDVLTD